MLPGRGGCELYGVNTRESAGCSRVAFVRRRVDVLGTCEGTGLPVSHNVVLRQQVDLTCGFGGILCNSEGTACFAHLDGIVSHDVVLYPTTKLKSVFIWRNICIMSVSVAFVAVETV